VVVLVVLVVFVAIAVRLRKPIQPVQSDNEEEEKKKKRQEVAQKKKENQKEKKPEPRKKADKHPNEVTCFRGHEGSVVGVAWSPNGQLIASIAQDRTLRVWDLSSLQGSVHKNYRINLPYDSGTAVAFSHDSTHVLVPLETSKEVIVVKIADSKKQDTPKCSILKTLPSHHKNTTIVSISIPQNTQYALTCGNGEEVALWDMKGNLLFLELTRQMTNYMACLSFDGTHALVATFSTEVRVYQISKKSDGSVEMKKTMALLGHKSAVFWCDISQDARLAVTASKDGTWKLWKVDVQYPGKENPPCILTVEHPEKKAFEMIALSPNSKYVTCITHTPLPIIYIYTITGKLIQQITESHKMRLSRLAWAPDSSMFTTSSEDKTVKVWSFPQTQMKK